VDFIKFESEDAVIGSTTNRPRTQTTTIDSRPSLSDEDYDGFNEIGNEQEQLPEYGFAADTDDDAAPFDNLLQNQNSILSGGSSANIVQATVVEDFDYARRVRDSNDRGNRFGGGIGIATISSITIGIISVLAFGLLIFLAVARRRRRQSDDFASATTPSSQSRTTITGTPVPKSGGPGDTPSMTTTYLDDVVSGPPSLPHQPDPVMPIDGHQTIVHSYEDFLLNAAGGGRGILSHLPPPPLSVSGTRDLSDDNDYLFSPSVQDGGSSSSSSSATPPLE
jgi:hypothetical protein